MQCCKLQIEVIWHQNSLTLSNQPKVHAHKMQFVSSWGQMTRWINWTCGGSSAACYSKTQIHMQLPGKKIKSQARGFPSPLSQELPLKLTPVFSIFRWRSTLVCRWLNHFVTLSLFVLLCEVVALLSSWRVVTASPQDSSVSLLPAFPSLAVHQHKVISLFCTILEVAET